MLPQCPDFLILSNVCSAEKYTKRNSVLLRLVYFSAEQTLLIPK